MTHKQPSWRADRRKTAERGYHQDALGASVLQPTEYVAAWRVVPK